MAKTETKAEREARRARMEANSQWLRELAEEGLARLPPERQRRLREPRRLHGAV